MKKTRIFCCENCGHVGHLSIDIKGDLKCGKCDGVLCFLADFKPDEPIGYRIGYPSVPYDDHTIFQCHLCLDVGKLGCRNGYHLTLLCDNSKCPNYENRWGCNIPNMPFSRMPEKVKKQLNEILGSDV